MAAKVRPGDREKTAKATGDSSFPTQTAAQIRSAIKLRHNGKSKGPGEVLSQCAAAVASLERAGKISSNEAEELRNKITHARQMDRGGGK
jgi:hypothetical protein